MTFLLVIGHSDAVVSFQRKRVEKFPECVFSISELTFMLPPMIPASVLMAVV